MATERRCRNNDCREWFDAGLRECPSCGTERWKFNPWLRHAQMNNALYAETERNK